MSPCALVTYIIYQRELSGNHRNGVEAKLAKVGFQESGVLNTWALNGSSLSYVLFLNGMAERLCDFFGPQSGRIYITRCAVFLSISGSLSLWERGDAGLGTN